MTDRVCAGTCQPGTVIEASAGGRIVRCGAKDCRQILKELPDHSLLRPGEERGGARFTGDEFEHAVIRA